MLAWREGRQRGEEGPGTPCRAWQVKVRSRAFLQAQLAAVEGRKLEPGQKSGLIYVFKGATQVRVWRQDRRSSKTG